MRHVWKSSPAADNPSREKLLVNGCISCHGKRAAMACDRDVSHGDTFSRQ